MAMSISAGICASRCLVAQKPLLPDVAKAKFSQGSIDACSLKVVDPPSTPEDRFVASQLASLLQSICRSRIPRRTAAIPVTLVDGHLGAPLPGVGDLSGPYSREAYAISIAPGAVTLRGRSSAGLFYAFETLRQLIDTDAGRPTIQLAEIEDWPSLAYRGFLMDMSHGAVPTLQEVERQLDFLARWKGNQYYFYVETNLDFNGFALLEDGASWSRQDIRTIVEYARQRHIDVVPCIELYGHLHDLFRVERYAGLGVLRHGGEMDPASPDSQQLLDNWLGQVATLFPSKWIHLGFDEPFELERAHQPANASTPPGQLWLGELQHFAAQAQSLGKKPMFWADIDEGAYIFNRYPELAAHLPKEAVAVPWFYDARQDYSNLLEPFAHNGVPNLVATGIADWDNIAPDFATTFRNIDGFLAAGRAVGTLGEIDTEWSDSAQALHRESYPAIAYGAASAWQSTPLDKSTFPSTYAGLMYPRPGSARMAAAIADIAASQTLLRQALGRETAFRMWDDPFAPASLASIQPQRKQLRDARLAAEDAVDQLLGIEAPSPGIEQEDRRSLLLAARLLDYAGMKFLYAQEIAGNFAALPAHPTKADIDYLLGRESSARNHSRVGDLLDLSGELAEDYRQEWLTQYRPFRLPTAMARWRAEQEFWRAFQSGTWAAVRSFHEGDTAPTLEQVRTRH
jgi:hypothetical protein